jgi:hypothetical protein
MGFLRAEAECTFGYMSIISAEKSILQTNLTNFTTAPSAPG